MLIKDAEKVPLHRWLSVAVFVTTFAALAWCIGFSNVKAQQTSYVGTPESSREVGATPHNPYTGDASCAKCHADFTSSQTSMSKAALAPLNNSSGTDYSRTTYREGEYSTKILPQKDGMQLYVTNGSGSLSVPIRWIFGWGTMGQTFILQYEDKYYESRASYYSQIDNLDLTLGHSKNTPSSLVTAMGRQLSRAELDKCFSCHTSQDIFDGKLNLDQVHPGITCENCHGPGSNHVANMETSHVPSKVTAIFNPGKLAPADVNDFCGSCHRTTRDVLDSRIRDIRNIRFQPYRLENSRCYDPSDARITCIACHDPHRGLVTDAVSYDAKCLACHANGIKKQTSAAAHACPKATRDCVSCHMPKLTLPGAHYAFTDHYIRVDQPGQPYPD
jgi:hypothetical protein